MSFKPYIKPQSAETKDQYFNALEQVPDTWGKTYDFMVGVYWATSPTGYSVAISVPSEAVGLTGLDEHWLISTFDRTDENFEAPTGDYTGEDDQAAYGYIRDFVAEVEEKEGS